MKEDNEKVDLNSKNYDFNHKNLYLLLKSSIIPIGVFINETNLFSKSKAGVGLTITIPPFLLNSIIFEFISSTS